MKKGKGLYRYAPTRSVKAVCLREDISLRQANQINDH